MRGSPVALHVLRYTCRSKFSQSPGVLVVRIARPESLAIWHRGRSHRRPNRSGSPNRRHFASLGLKKHPDFSHRRPTSQDFRWLFFSRNFLWFQIKRMCFRIASEKKLFASLVIWGCAIRIASHIAVASRGFGPLSLGFSGVAAVSRYTPLKGPVAPVALERPRVSHIKLSLKRCRATGGCSSYTCGCRATLCN